MTDRRREITIVEPSHSSDSSEVEAKVIVDERRGSRSKKPRKNHAKAPKITMDPEFIDQLEEHKFKLDESEQQHLQSIFERIPDGIRTLQGFDDLLHTLCIDIGARTPQWQSELEQLFASIDILDLQTFLHIMQEEKECHILRQEDVLGDVTDAFLAMGGDAGQDIPMDSDVLRSMCEQFELTINVDKMLVELDGDCNKKLDFEEFAKFLQETEFIEEIQKRKLVGEELTLMEDGETDRDDLIENIPTSTSLRHRQSISGSPRLLTEANLAINDGPERENSSTSIRSSASTPPGDTRTEHLTIDPSDVETDFHRLRQNKRERRREIRRMLRMKSKEDEQPHIDPSEIIKYRFEELFRKHVSVSKSLRSQAPKRHTKKRKRVFYVFGNPGNSAILKSVTELRNFQKEQEEETLKLQSIKSRSTSSEFHKQNTEIVCQKISDQVRQIRLWHMRGDVSKKEYQFNVRRATELLEALRERVRAEEAILREGRSEFSSRIVYHKRGTHQWLGPSPPHVAKATARPRLKGMAQRPEPVSTHELTKSLLQKLVTHRLTATQATQSFPHDPPDSHPMFSSHSNNSRYIGDTPASSNVTGDPVAHVGSESFVPLSPAAPLSPLRAAFRRTHQPLSSHLSADTIHK